MSVSMPAPRTPRGNQPPSPNSVILPRLDLEVERLPYDGRNELRKAEQSIAWANAMYDAYLKVTPRHPLSRQEYFKKLLKNLLEPPCPPPPRCDRSPRRNTYYKHGRNADTFFEIDKRVLRGLAGLPQEEDMVNDASAASSNCVGPSCGARAINRIKRLFSSKGGRKYTRRHKMRRSRRKTRHSRR